LRVDPPHVALGGARRHRDDGRECEAVCHMPTACAGRRRPP
jgi:hypothetical protein